ncbi:MAG: phosphate ABC transporter permease subunit PstC [Ignavibacteriae bacterium]|nr:phosphate ABC transporter permease subunit PstC [Ignavibacteriota bacterium]
MPIENQNTETINEEEIANAANMNSSLYSKKIALGTRVKEKIIEIFFAINGAVALIFIVLIFIFLFKEGIQALNDIGVLDFIYYDQVQFNDSIKRLYEWYPTSSEPRFSLVPLIVGTLLTAIPATLISTFFGVGAGVYLSEIAKPGAREFLKPIIELFAGIPTVVLGFLMLVVGASFFNDLLEPTNRLNAFIAALGLSFVIIPIIASMTEDALRSIPNDLRMASYGLGATKWQTVSKVILPAGFSGVSASIILGFGRAIGETMIVLMASGNAANITTDILLSVRTMTATIAAEMGEVSQGSDHYYALFFIGIILFTITFFLNLIAEIIINKMRKKNVF